MASASASASAPAPAGVAASAAAAAATAARVGTRGGDERRARVSRVGVRRPPGRRDAEKTRDVSCGDSSERAFHARDTPGARVTPARARAVAWKSPSASRNGRVERRVLCGASVFWLARGRRARERRAPRDAPRPAAPAATCARATAAARRDETGTARGSGEYRVLERGARLRVAPARLRATLAPARRRRRRATLPARRAAAAALWTRWRCLFRLSGFLPQRRGPTARARFPAAFPAPAAARARSSLGAPAPAACVHRRGRPRLLRAGVRRARAVQRGAGTAQPKAPARQ